VRKVNRGEKVEKVEGEKVEKVELVKEVDGGDRRWRVEKVECGEDEK
jgi:hypothetical protein